MIDRINELEILCDGIKNIVGNRTVSITIHDVKNIHKLDNSWTKDALYVPDTNRIVAYASKGGITLFGKSTPIDSEEIIEDIDK